LRLGLCPIGKFVFSHEDALVQKRRIVELLQRLKIDFVDLDQTLPDGMVRDQAQVRPVVEHFQRERIDALFIPHCNFGTEGAAAMIAKQCGVPTLLWGPRDEAPLPDGTRLRDTLCGLLATSRVLHTLRVPFSYIENCATDDPALERGLVRFLRAARVVRTLKRMKIAHIGGRIDFFWSTIVSESDLLQRFGIEILPVEMPLFLHDLQQRAERRRADYERELAAMETWIDTRACNDRNVLLLNFALRDAAMDLVRQHDLDALSFQTFSSIPQLLGGFLGLGVAMINELGVPVGCESDIHGAISSALLEAAADDEALSFLADLTIRHPADDNAVLLWHFEAPLSLRHETSGVKIGAPWILKDLPPGLLSFRLKDGPLTLCRFDGDSAGYRLGVGEARTIDGPFTQEFYTWMKVHNWPAWEQRLIRGPYAHHASFIFEHCADVLEEAARFLPQLSLERIDREI
jgi:L-fucose isomerase-like protein